MLDFNIAGPIIGILAIIDIAIHLHLDFKKNVTNNASHFSEPSSHISTTVIVVVSVATILSFILVGVIPLVWLFSASELFLFLLGTVYSPEIVVWLPGFVLLIGGILLHIWSRAVRQEMAASWAMRNEHILVTNGPYSRIRNPSYSSYILCFIGLV
ncbi:MAG: methyltransferase family protein, partial [Candidatus Thorarchaeota archaeon]